MFVKLVVVACCVAASVAKWHGPLAGGQPADLYPAGVSPQACPNFPNCDNPAVAANPGAPAHGGWNGAQAGAWNGGHGGGWNGAGAGGWNGGHAGGWNGAQAGGWNGAQAGGWNGGHGGAGAWNGAAAGHAQPAQVPAGVDPHSCPNYPFCH